MQDVCFVGFDTSNYTTSVAVADGAGRVIANIKRPLPVKAGECGLRQSDAVFAHVRNLPDAVEELREAVRGRRVIGVGCSTRPRSVEGSYMPCFLAGRAAAGSFSSAVDAPLFEVSHQDGHLMAALYSSGAGEAVAASPFLAFHVSGGTTEVLYVRPKDEVFSAERIGGSADLNAGQCVDRIGVMLGLSFPCGRELEALATTNSARYPRPRISVKGRLPMLRTEHIE